MRPEPVDGRRGEVAVVRGRQPVGEGRAVRHRPQVRRRSLEELGLGSADGLFVVRRVGDRNDGTGRDRLFAVLLGDGLGLGFGRGPALEFGKRGRGAPLGDALALGRQVAEERGHAPEVLLRPLVHGRVDVALGALELDAHE